MTRADDGDFADVDAVALVRALIDKITDGLDSYHAVDVAEDVVLRLRREDPALLRRFLDEMAVQVISQMIRDRDRSARTHARGAGSAGRRSVFADMVSEAEAGKPERLTDWLSVRYALEGDERKKLGALTGVDLKWLADDRSHAARRATLEVAFFRMLARKIGTDTVADHYTNEEIESARRRLLG